MNAATEAQVRAARPGESSWVSANAGSGKTRVLTDRVARLLLSGADPQKVLCLTYTKAAAAEMQNRLFRTLGAWAMLPDDELRAALEALGEPGATLPDTRLDLARTLFARALETPGGLKIQTIHAFCDSLLRRFPLEAGVAPQFAVLEDRQARGLRDEALEDVAERDPAAVEDLARHFTGDDPDRLLEDLGRHREAFAGDFDAGALAAAFGIDADLTVAELHDAVMTSGTADLLAALVPVLGASGPADVRAAAKIAAAITARDAEARLIQLESVLLTQSGQAPFTAKTGTLPTKGIRASHPILTEGLHALMARVETARPRRLAVGALARSAALHRFARLYLAEYDRRKQALGLLDFDDLIARSALLLRRRETAAWVLWRLDGGLDHILVDEAQDTSPQQWTVIDAISAEFFAGAGARALERTIFVVGDEKQSIYSFQGADPAEFGKMKARFGAMIEGLGAELQRCDLLHSFRSAPPVLALVDAVFAGPAGAGLSAGISHRAIDPAMPGRVELWPFLEKGDAPDESAWDDPVDAPPPDDPVAELAGRIAARIAGWLADGTILPRKNGDRAIRAGDVMILVQRRGPLFHAVIRALKQAAVPVAGADVLRIGAELAVKDLLAALRVAATPADDLSLAALLRSPLGGLSETELFDLAHGREGSLWQALRDADPARCRPARELVSDLMGQADYLRPFELFERVLIRHDGRRRLVARLGQEAEDGIDALLDQALAYESVEAPSVTGFLGWIDRDDVQVKRRTDATADQVRVMTVHGAKGLESPIVILPDTGDRQEGANPPHVLRLDDGSAVWKSRKDAAPPAELVAEQARRSSGAGGAPPSSLRGADPRGEPADRLRRGERAERGRRKLVPAGLGRDGGPGAGAARRDPRVDGGLARGVGAAPDGARRRGAGPARLGAPPGGAEAGRGSARGVAIRSRGRPRAGGTRGRGRRGRGEGARRRGASAAGRASDAPAGRLAGARGADPSGARRSRRGPGGSGGRRHRAGSGAGFRRGGAGRGGRERGCSGPRRAPRRGTDRPTRDP